FVSRSTATMRARTASSNVSGCGADVRGIFTGASRAGSWRLPPCDRITARWTTCCSSRTSRATDGAPRSPSPRAESTRCAGQGAGRTRRRSGARAAEYPGSVPQGAEGRLETRSADREQVGTKLALLHEFFERTIRGSDHPDVGPDRLRAADFMFDVILRSHPAEAAPSVRPSTGPVPLRSRL